MSNIINLNSIKSKERKEEEHLYIIYKDGRKIVFLGVESSEISEKIIEYDGLFVVSSYIIEEKDYKLIILNSVINEKGHFSTPITTIVKLYEPEVREQQFLINIFKGSSLPFNIDMKFTEKYKKMEYICSSYLGIKDHPILLPKTEFNGLKVKTYFKDVKIVEPIKKYKYCKDQYVKVGNKNLEIVECRPTFDENDTVEYFDVSEDEDYYNNISLVSFNTIYDFAFKMTLYKTNEDIQVDITRLAPSSPEQASLSVKISYFEEPELFLSWYDIRTGCINKIKTNENSSMTKIDDFNFDIVLDYDWIPEEGIEVYFYSIKFNIKKFK